MASLAMNSDRKLHSRKHSVQVSAHQMTPKLIGGLDATEDGQDYQPAFRKKMSLPH